MKTNKFHLTATEDEWVLTQEGKSKPLGHYKSKDTALETALEVVAAQTGLLKMHCLDGTVVEGRTYVRGENGIRCRQIAVPARRPGNRVSTRPRLVPQPA